MSQEIEEQDECSTQESHPVWDSIAVDDFYYLHFIDHTRIV